MKKVIKKCINTFLIMLMLFSYCTMVNAVNAKETVNDIKHYYYEQLNDVSKILYDALESNIENLKKDYFSIEFKTEFNELLNQEVGQNKLFTDFQSAVDAFYFDHPELFYIDLNKFTLVINCFSIGQIKNYTVKISPSTNNYLYDYFKSEEEVINAIVEVEKAREGIINSFVNENYYEKILKVHNLLANLNEYDTTLQKSNIRNIYGAFIKNEIVCEGYAKAFKYILDYLNIECILVAGNATNSSNQTEAHMWNYVKINGVWYGVDVTWDDPVMINGSNIITVGPVDTYFLKGKSTFIESHIPNSKISNYGMSFFIPELSDEDYKYNGLPFMDVLENAWYYNAVKYNYEKGMIKGTSDTTFDPNGDLTRGMLVTILWRMEGSQKVSANQFTDIKEGVWYSVAVNWAATNKIVNGYGNGKFGPNDKITREQLAVILRNYALYKKKDVSARTELSKFEDSASISNYAIDGVSWAVANKVISGKFEGTKIDPHGKATRAEASAMLYNYCMNIK